MRTLHSKLKSSDAGGGQDQQHQQQAYDAYGQPMAPPSRTDYNLARTRKLYFTGFVVCLQIVITWWLSKHLVANRPAAAAAAAGFAGL